MRVAHDACARVATRQALRLLLVLFVLLLCTHAAAAADATSASREDGASGSNGNRWAVIVSSSRYFFNYRHTASALTLYHLLRQHGIDDDHILLFLGDSYACDPRNLYAGAIYSGGEDDDDDDAESSSSRGSRVHMPSSSSQRAAATTTRGRPNLYDCGAQVDYAGDDVDVRRVLQVLQGRYDVSTPPTRRLLTDAQSHILIYVVGHSAPSFLKFHDAEFLSSTDVAETLSMMHSQGRYGKVVLLADTCYAVALCEHVTAPNVLCIASSSADKESYSHGHDRRLGVSMTSRWMYETQRMLEQTSCHDATRMSPSMAALLDAYEKAAGGGGGGRASGRTSVLHRSWYEFTYGASRRVVPGASSSPAHRDAPNDAHALHTWRVSDFVCPDTTRGRHTTDDMAGMTVVPIRTNLLDDDDDDA